MKNRNRYEFTNHLRKILMEKRLSHSRFASELGVHPKIVAAWCENKRQPDPVTCFGITRLLSVGLEEIMTARRVGSDTEIISRIQENDLTIN